MRKNDGITVHVNTVLELVDLSRGRLDVIIREPALIMRTSQKLVEDRKAVTIPQLLKSAEDKCRRHAR